MTNKGQQKRQRTGSGVQKKVGFSSATGLMKRSQSDSKLYHEDGLLCANNAFGGSASSLDHIYIMPAALDQRGNALFHDGSKERTCTGNSVAVLCESLEGLSIILHTSPKTLRGIPSLFSTQANLLCRRHDIV